jgi:hypothetical protein
MAPGPWKVVWKVAWREPRKEPWTDLLMGLFDNCLSDSEASWPVGACRFVLLTW